MFLLNPYRYGSGVASYPYDDAVIADAPLFLYGFNESSGFTLFDLANTRNGVYQNAVGAYAASSNTAGLVAGTRGTYNPDGVNDIVQAYNSYNYTSGEFAVDLILKRVSNTTGRVFEINHAFSNLLGLLEVNTGGVPGNCRWLVKHSGGNVEVDFTLALNTVTHIAVWAKTSGTRTMGVAKNGVSQGTASPTSAWAYDTGSANAFNIGASRTPDTWSDTKVSGFAVYDSIKSLTVWDNHRIAAGL